MKDCCDQLNDYEREKLEIAVNTLQGVKQVIQKEKRNLIVKRKGSSDFVTNVDYAVQEFLINSNLVGSDGVISEENLLIRGSSPYVWLIDPIDGTVNGLIKGTGDYYVLITLTLNKKPVFSVIYMPKTDKTFISTLNGVIVKSKAYDKNLKLTENFKKTGIYNGYSKSYLISTKAVEVQSFTCLKGIDLFLNGKISWFFVDRTHKKLCFAHDYYPIWSLCKGLGLRFLDKDGSEDFTFNQKGLMLNTLGRIPKGFWILRNEVNYLTLQQSLTTFRKCLKSRNA